MVDVSKIARFTPSDRTLHSAQKSGDARAFVDFMLDMILRTLKARGEPQGGKKKVVRKCGKKTADRLIELIRGNPKITFAGMVSATGVSCSAIQKHTVRLRNAQRLRRVGPDKGRRREVIGNALGDG